MSKDSSYKRIRTVGITGSTRGIGKEMARGFAQKGWQVAGCSRSPADLEKLSTELGPEHLFDVVDVSDDLSVKAFP